MLIFFFRIEVGTLCVGFAFEESRFWSKDLALSCDIKEKENFTLCNLFFLSFEYWDGC